MSESANIQENVTDCINKIFRDLKSLSTHLKPVEIGKQNMGRDFIQDIIVTGYCTMYMSGMTSSSLQGIIENTLDYFRTGLYDTNKTTGTTRNDKSYFDVRAWVYTPDTHNDAGEWYHIYTFDNFFDADECITMLKQIEAELKRVG